MRRTLIACVGCLLILGTTDLFGQTSRATRTSKRPMPTLRGIEPIHTDLLEKKSATFNSDRNLFAYVQPPPPPPPKPPPPPPDRDGDGVPDFRDNCPDTANPDQADIDRDGKGSACDEEETAPPPPPPAKARPPGFNYVILGVFGTEDNMLAAMVQNAEIVNVRVGETFGPKDEFILRRIGIETVEIGFSNFPDEVKRVPVGR